VARPPNLAVLLTHCGQLILRNISIFDATKCQIIRLKCTKFDFRWGSAPYFPLYLRGPTSKGRAKERGRGRRGEGDKGRRGKRRGKGGKGKGRNGRDQALKYFGLEPPLNTTVQAVFALT